MPTLLFTSWTLLREQQHPFPACVAARGLRFSQVSQSHSPPLSAGDADLGWQGGCGWWECTALTPPALPCSPSTSSRFCRDSAISLSLFYNNGAQPCGCHEAGARGSQCQPFGGQCPCKPNVIGRQCSRCATGYWGFPNCRREFSCLLLCLPRACSVSIPRSCIGFLGLARPNPAFLCPLQPVTAGHVSVMK